MRRIPLIAACAVGVLIAGIAVVRLLPGPNDPSVTPAATVSPAAASDIPLPDAAARVTKKTFGLAVSPGNSPVSPERFTGLHTGVDFELFPGEDPHRMAVRALCDGTILVARHATGYGGVIVQSCSLEQRPVTVIYGHVWIESARVAVGSAVKRGDTLAVLGAAYSTETDGERAHLHLGIHRGAAVDIRGYVASQQQLAAWIDPLTVIPAF